MNFKILILTMTILGLSSCSDSGVKNLGGTPGGGSNLGETLSQAGTGSGGGEFDDAAKAEIELAKTFLIKALRNSDDKIFEEFPQEFKKQTLISIIQNLKFSENNRERDNETLLMDFDEKTNQLFYTKRFVEKYGQKKYANTDEDNLKNLQEHSTMILKELSHLLGLGKSTTKDRISSLFGLSFLNHLLTETHICEGELNSHKYSMVLNPQTGFSYFVKGGSIDFSYEVTEDAYLNSEVWQLGNVFPFFQLKGDAASSAIQIPILENQSRIGVQPLSPFDVIKILEFPNNDESLNFIFWNMQDYESSYKYSMEYKDIESDSNGVQTKNEMIKEDGLVSLNINPSTPSQNFLSTKVTLNEVIDADQTINLPLSCKQHVRPYDFEVLKNLDNVTNDSSGNLEEALNNISAAMAFKNKYNVLNCENATEYNLKLICESLENNQ